MKKLILINLILFINLNFNSFSKEPPPCPYGSNLDSITFNNYIGCQWTIIFCWSCQHIGTKPTMWVSNIRYFSTPSPECDRVAPSQNEIERAIIEWVEKVGCAGEPCRPYAERDTGYLDMPMCQKWINTVYPNSNVTWMESCVTNLICRKKFTYCTDYTHNPPVLEITPISTELIGDINACSDLEPQIPPPGFTFQDNWETYCFKKFLCSF